MTTVASKFFFEEVSRRFLARDIVERMVVLNYPQSVYGRADAAGFFDL